MILSHAAKAASLTDAQRVYLRLVAEGRTSKQIAQAVGGSHHTINAQIGVAMRILGAASRQQAAAMLDEADSRPSYEPSYDARTIADPAVTAEMLPQDERSDGGERWIIPVATATRPINTMGLGQRIGWVLMIAASVTLLLAGMVSGVISLLTDLGRLV